MGAGLDHGLIELSDACITQFEEPTTCRATSLVQRRNSISLVRVIAKVGDKPMGVNLSGAGLSVPPNLERYANQSLNLDSHQV